MKIILWLILSLSSLSALAEAIPFPACNINNQPVTYRAASSQYANAYSSGVYIADSDIVDGRPVIHYNLSLLSTFPAEWTLQIMLHECAHFKLHTKFGIKPPNKEYEADCHSAKTLKEEYDYKDEDFAIIIKSMKTLLPSDRISSFTACTKR